MSRVNHKFFCDGCGERCHPSELLAVSDYHNTDLCRKCHLELLKAEDSYEKAHHHPDVPLCPVGYVA